MGVGANPVVIGDQTCRVTLHAPEEIRNHGLEHRIDVVAGSFQGSLAVACYAKPYRRFLKELTALYNTLSGEARLGPSYENLEMVFSGDGRGHVTVKVEVFADHERPIALSFRIYLDQSDLPQIIRHVEQAFVHDVPQDY